MSAAPSSKPVPDQFLVDVADYVSQREVGGEAARKMARYALFDALGCIYMTLDVPDCRALLGPIVPGTVVPNGARVPGTDFVMDPVKAAFDTACLIRWLDFNDAWATGGHPSDSIGGIVASADYISRSNIAAGRAPLTVGDVLTSLTKAYEIHGALSEGNTFDAPGYGMDSTTLVRIASTAAITQLFGGTKEQIINAVSNAFADGSPLNVFRKVPNAGTRKSWAAGDATSRAVRLALMAIKGLMGYPTVLTAKTWGFYENLYAPGIKILNPLGSRVVENVMFKISFPTQRHAQTAAECAVQLHKMIDGKFDQIERVEVFTHKLAKSMISVSGPLTTVAARDHCLEYVVAIGLVFGTITGESYEDHTAADPRIDALREKIVVEADERFSTGYYDPAMRSNGNSVQVFFRDGTSTPKITEEYAIGDPKRRADGLPIVEKKFEAPMARVLANRAAAVFELFRDPARLEAMPVNQFMDMLVS